MEPVTLELSRHITRYDFADLPANVVDAAQRHITDCLGVMLAGSASEPGQIAAQLVADLDEVGTATVVGTGGMASLPNAAWANGTAAHALDFDDTGFSHPTACILPPALAVGEHVGATGREFLTATIMGYEVFERIAAAGRQWEPDLRARGYHPTALYGCAAAAAVSGLLLDVDDTQMATAMGLALANAGGLSEQHGTWGKGVHAGNAARAGITAALLAKRGFWASTEILEARYGFFHAIFGDRQVKIAGITDGFGDDWAIVTPGLNIKPYPACGRALRAIDAALKLHHDLQLDAEDIARIEIEAFPDYVHTLLYRAPTRGFHGKFSLDYCVASGLLDGDVTLDSFSDEAASRPALRRLLNVTEIIVHEDWSPDRRRDNPVTVQLRDGTRATEKVDKPRGSVGNPFTLTELEDKFGSCAEYAGFTSDDADRVLAAVRGLRDLTSVRDVMSMVRTGTGERLVGRSATVTG